MELSFSYRIETRIEICRNCGGIGKISKNKVTDHHKHEHEEWEEKCPICGGTGREVHEITHTYRKLTEEELKISKRSAI